MADAPVEPTPEERAKLVVQQIAGLPTLRSWNDAPVLIADAIRKAAAQARTAAIAEAVKALRNDVKRWGISPGKYTEAADYLERALARPTGDQPWTTQAPAQRELDEAMVERVAIAIFRSRPIITMDWPELDEETRGDFRIMARVALAAAASQAEEADAKRLAAEVDARCADIAMNGTRWMQCHDQLLGWIQARPEVFKQFIDSDPRGPLPSPADLPNALAEAERRGAERMRAAAVEAARANMTCGCGRADCYTDRIPEAISDAIAALPLPGDPAPSNKP